MDHSYAAAIPYLAIIPDITCHKVKVKIPVLQWSIGRMLISFPISKAHG